jgi:hypothetical protein
VGVYYIQHIEVAAAAAEAVAAAQACLGSAGGFKVVGMHELHIKMEFLWSLTDLQLHVLAISHLCRVMHLK